MSVMNSGDRGVVRDHCVLGPSGKVEATPPAPQQNFVFMYISIYIHTHTHPKM